MDLLEFPTSLHEIQNADKKTTNPNLIQDGPQILMVVTNHIEISPNIRNDNIPPKALRGILSAKHIIHELDHKRSIRP
jgi:hypothetical protein